MSAESSGWNMHMENIKKLNWQNLPLHQRIIEAQKLAVPGIVSWMSNRGRDFVEEVCATIETGNPKFDIPMVLEYQRYFYSIDWEEKDYEMLSSPSEAFMMGERYSHFKSYCTQSCYACGSNISLRPKFSVAKSVWYYECENHRSKK